jgi:cytochrome c-type biogenesis protein CcmH
LPPLALVGGGLALWANMRRRSGSKAGEDDSLLKLTADEEARLEALLSGKTPEKPV